MGNLICGAQLDVQSTVWHHFQNTWSDLLATSTTLRSELLQKEEAMNAELERLNSALLTTLSQATGNILDNRELLSTLDATKAAAVDISGALAESVRLQVCLGSIQYMFKHYISSSWRTSPRRACVCASAAGPRKP